MLDKMLPVQKGVEADAFQEAWLLMTRSILLLVTSVHKSGCNKQDKERKLEDATTSSGQGTLTDAFLQLK